MIEYIPIIIGAGICISVISVGIWHEFFDRW